MPADHGKAVVDMLGTCLEGLEIEELFKNINLQESWRRD